MINGNLIFYFFQDYQISRISSELLWTVSFQENTWNVLGGSDWILEERE